MSATLHLGPLSGILATYRTEMARNLRSGKKRAEQDTTLLRDSPFNLLDSVQAEVDRLQRENKDLLASLERDRRVSLGPAEAEQLLEQQRQMQEDLQAELVESQERGCHLEERCTQLGDQLTRVLEVAELERLRAVDELRRKYNDREERLLQQLQERFLSPQSRMCAVEVTPSAGSQSDGVKTTSNSVDGGSDAPSTSVVSNVGTPEQACSDNVDNGNSVVSSTPPVQKSTQLKENVDAHSDLSIALLAQQFPPPQL